MNSAMPSDEQKGEEPNAKRLKIAEGEAKDDDTDSTKSCSPF
jgi:hypothetical protein